MPCFPPPLFLPFFFPSCFSHCSFYGVRGPTTFLSVTRPEGQQEWEETKRFLAQVFCCLFSLSLCLDKVWIEKEDDVNDEGEAAPFVSSFPYSTKPSPILVKCKRSSSDLPSMSVCLLFRFLTSSLSPFSPSVRMFFSLLQKNKTKSTSSWLAVVSLPSLVYPRNLSL